MVPARFMNRLTDDFVCQNSVKGPGGFFIGSPPRIYNPTKFGNGVHGGTGPTNTHDVPCFPKVFSTKKGTIEVWVRNDFTYPDGLIHNILTSYNGIIGALDGYFDLAFFTPTADLNVNMFSPPGSGSTPAVSYGFTWAGGSLPAGSDIHVAINFDNSQADPDRIHAFINNIPLAVAYINGGTPWVESDLDIVPGGYYSPDMTIGTIKISDFVKSDFSDRFSERSGLQDKQVIS